MSLTIDPQVEIYVVSTVDGPGWLNISDLDLVLTDGGLNAIQIGHGYRGMRDGIPEPSSCGMRWDGRGGRLWPKNPSSDLYPSLGLNTPLRVAFGLIAHTFPGTVVDDWSDVGGLPVVNTGLGGTVAAADWQQTPGVGTHSVPTTNAYRQSVLDGWDQEDDEQTIEFQLPFADTTGAAVEPANLIFRYTADDHLLLRVVVNADDTVTAKWILIDTGVGEFDQTDVYTSTIVNAGQWIKVKGNIEGNRLQAKIWDPDDPEPLEWLIDEAPNILNTFLHTGSIGVRTGVATGNTNAKPIVVSYRNWTVRHIPFFGEISKYHMEVDESGEDITIPITASGITRRLGQGTPPTLSALRRAIPQQAGLQQYWPLEDGSGSTEFGSGLPGMPPMVPLRGTPGYAEYSDLASSRPLPTGNGSDWRGLVPAYTDTGNIQISFVLHLPAGDQADRAILCRWYTDHPSAKLWQLIYRTPGGQLQLQAWNSESAFVYESVVAGFDMNDSNRLISVQLSDDGADVDWAIRSLKMDTGGSGDLLTGTAAGLQISTVKSVWMNLTFTDTPAYGHVCVQSVLTDFFELNDESIAWNSEFLNRRVERLLNESDYACTLESSVDDNYDMGPQEPETLPNLLTECLTVDSGGVWFDARTHAGIMFRDRGALYNQDTWISLSLAGKQLLAGWGPVIGDRDIRNQVTVTRKNGAEATYALESGPLSILPKDDGGAGPYGTEVTVNTEDDSGLQQIAAWRVALGTIDKPLYPAAVVELAADAVLADSSIANRLRDLRPGRMFEVTGAEEVFEYDAVPLMCVGYTMVVSQFQCEYSLIGEPAGPFTVFELEHDDLGRLDSGTASLENAIDATQTTFTVQVDDTTVWIDSATHPTDFPFDILVGGERMTVTDITTATPSFVSVGTAAHADNTTVAPGAPAGAQAGDLLLVLGATRDLASAPTISNGNYLRLMDAASLVLWGRIWDGVEALPTIGTTGGSAGSTVTGQIACFRNVANIARATAVFGNGSAQDMLLPGMSTFMSKSLLISAGQKQDDWTSVATLPGATEIAESSTTVGSDQGVVWDYQAFTGEVAVPQRSFIVTGGASANSRTGQLVLGNWQTFTVTRSVNGVVKSHNAEDEIHIFFEPHYSL
jgi:hypothetical protein